jgi:hypothetical protein
MFVVPPIEVIAPAVEVAITWDGWVIVMEAGAVLPRESVTVKTYCPLPTWNVPVPVYGDVPPVAETTTVARCPLQFMGTVCVAVAVNTAGCVIVILLIIVQPLASLIVTL